MGFCNIHIITNLEIKLSIHSNFLLTTKRILLTGRSWTDNWLLATTEPSKFQLIILNRDYHICLKNSELIHITAIGGNVDSRKERKWN